MKSRLGIALTTAAALGSAAFLIVGAEAQQGPAPAPQPPASEAQPVLPPPGHGPGEAGHGGQAGHFSPRDRAAFFDAHIAAVKAGLELTPDQEKLWGPVEQAVRNLAKDMIALRQKVAQEGRPTDPVARLQRAADAATTRGADLQKLASAAQPLWASLSDDQKQRLPMLMHGMRGMRGGNEMQGRNGMYQHSWTQPQNGWRQRMRGMMQRSAPDGDGDSDGR